MATVSIQDLINSGVFEANQNNPVLIDGTYYQPVYGYGGSGMDAQQGALENVITYKADENQVGGNVNWYDPTGQYQQSTQQQEVAGSFIEGLGEALTDPVVMAAILAAYSGGLLGGTTPAIGNGAFLGEGVASGIPAFDAAYTAAGGVFNPAFGLPIGNGAFLGEGVPTGINAWDTAYTNAGGVFNPAFALGPDGLVGTPLVTPPAVATPAVTTPVVNPPVTPPVVNPPVVPPTPPIVPPVPPIVPPTITDILKVIAPIATIAAAANVVTPKTTTPTGFDIVPVPTDWKTPNKPTTAPYTPLTPIDFGTRELLRGTQWEKFLDPNYGQVPEAVKYSQPSSMSYNDLMSILGSKQGMPSASGLSINDIISGIQNQYGQVPSSTMG